ncbi:MAG: methyltransferase family protein [Terriglobia bacterium]
MRDAIAVLVLLVQLPVPLFWLAVHPAIGFWRGRPRTWYYVWALTVWLGTAVVLLAALGWWLAERFARHPLVAVLGVSLVAADVWLITRVKRAASWRVLVGLPELAPAGQGSGALMARGIYGRLRHPRYLGMMLSWLGAVLVSGSTRLLALVLGFIVLALWMTELEEGELLRRLGTAYADYRRRVPRFFPRFR